MVALRKESVDRNLMPKKLKKPCIMSLSARRAWIEIKSHLWYFNDLVVALRKESVDRNRMA